LALRGTRVLVSSYSVPRFDRDSGSRRLLDFIGFLLEAGCSVTFLSALVADPRQARYVRHLQQLGVPVFHLPVDPVDEIVRESRFDVALLSFWPVAELVGPILRELSPTTRIVVDSVDLHFLRDARRLLEITDPDRPPFDAQYGEQLVGELNAYADADLVLTVSEVESGVLDSYLGATTVVRVAPDCEDLEPSPIPMREREGILFIGNFNHNPNVHAAEVLCRQIVPRIDATLLDRHPVHIVGDGLNDSVRSFANGSPNVRLVGWVPSVVPYLQRARVSILPLFFGAGTKRKIIQALMTGTPTVSTSVGIEGLGLIPANEEVIVADDPEGLSAAVSKLLVDDRAWERLASNGHPSVVDRHSRPGAREAFLAAVEEALGAEPKRKKIVRNDPTVFRQRAVYQETQRLRDALWAAPREVIPAGARLAVVTEWAAEPLRLDPFTVLPYPTAELAGSAQAHNEDIEEARKYLESLISQGAEFLVVPAPFAGWLQARPLLHRYLDSTYHVVLGKDDLGVVYSLSASTPPPPSQGGDQEPSYSECVRRIRETVCRELPDDATVIVVSKGDEGLLDLYGRRAWHFPQDSDGKYPLYYPPDGPSVIAHLEALRARGGQYLLFPQPALWWLDRYPQFSSHLYRHYPVVLKDDQCVIFSLKVSDSSSNADSWQVQLPELIAACHDDRGADLSILDWNTGLQLQNRFPGHAVFTPPTDERTLPYVDGSIDLVAVSSPDGVSLREARRVAGYAVVDLAPHAIEVHRVGKQAEDPNMRSASIVIPTHDAVEHLELCLIGLDETLPRPFRGEVIVVDDASGEEMQRRLREWQASRPYLKVIRNAERLGILASRNRGAGAAKSDILVFLNDDTAPQTGWLQALLRTFRDHPDAGAVGGKMLLPDGSMREAGNFVFADGSTAHFGQDDRLIERPLYNYVREVDYCSAALLATPRALFAEIGGFDKRYGDGYYGDIDYCFAARKHGRRAYYQPESVAVQADSEASGTAVNQSKFARKWKDALQEQPKRPTSLDPTTSHGFALSVARR
jgi:GT2 family glycosyltransferase/glycosyltransferase involved in cell wall biosynthesis